MTPICKFPNQNNNYRCEKKYRPKTYNPCNSH